MLMMKDERKAEIPWSYIKSSIVLGLIWRKDRSSIDMYMMVSIVDLSEILSGSSKWTWKNFSPNIYLTQDNKIVWFVIYKWLPFGKTSGTPSIILSMPGTYIFTGFKISKNGLSPNMIELELLRNVILFKLVHW